MEKFTNVEKLPVYISNKVKSYLQELVDLYQDKILSIAVYGSAAGGDFIPKVSDVNMLIIFDRLEFADFKKGLKLISKGIKSKISAPLFLTKEYIERSLDVFPTEFLEMKDNHINLYGQDLLNPLNIDESNIRLHCEQQLKGKLIRIRQAYLEVGLKNKGMEALLKESFTSLIPIFRNLLRLKGLKPPVGKDKIIIQLCEEFSLNYNLFLAILKDKKNDEKIEGRRIEEALRDYIDELDKLSKIVDKL